jgi:hypothetical protein
MRPMPTIFVTWLVEKLFFIYSMWYTVFVDLSSPLWKNRQESKAPS